MEWIITGCLFYVGCWVCYLIGKYIGRHETENEIAHIAECLFEENEELVALKKLNTRSVKDIRTKIFGSKN